MTGLAGESVKDLDEKQATESESDSAAWDRRATQRALDDLFTSARKYRGSREFLELLQFAARFRAYAPFNAMLVNIQMPGAVFVAPAPRWQSEYGRQVLPAARPLVILQPMGPVMFVFDVSETEPILGVSHLPVPVTAPFEVRRGDAGDVTGFTLENAQRDGVRVTFAPEGSQSAGRIWPASGNAFLNHTVRRRPPLDVRRIPVRYEVIVNDHASPATQYATLVHELAHLYCGHLGTPNSQWWPDRRWCDQAVEEFEAESISYLVCARLGIDNPSEQYLAHFAEQHAIVPDISLDLVMKVAGLIEQMGRERLPMRTVPVPRPAPA